MASPLDHSPASPTVAESVHRPRPPVVVGVFGSVSVLIWATRLRNIAADDLDGIDLVVRVTTAAALVVLGAGVLAAWLVARRGERGHRRLHRTTVAAAAVTAAVWVHRAVAIAVDADHSIGFKLVHAVLAAGSVALGAAAGRGVSRWRVSVGPPRRVTGGT